MSTTLQVILTILLLPISIPALILLGPIAIIVFIIGGLTTGW